MGHQQGRWKDPRSPFIRLTLAAEWRWAGERAGVEAGDGPTRGSGRERQTEALGVEPITLMSENGAQEVCELLWVRGSHSLLVGLSAGSDSGAELPGSSFAESSFQGLLMPKPAPNSPRVGLLTSGKGGLHGTDLSLNHLPEEGGTGPQILFPLTSALCPAIPAEKGRSAEVGLG